VPYELDEYWGGGETVSTHLEIDRDVHMTPTATTNESPGSTRDHILSGGEFSRSERVDNLVDTRPVEWDLVVVGVAEMSECELVVATLIWLESDFSTRTSNGLGQLAGGLLVLLRLIIHLEGAGAAKDKRSRNTGITGTLERVSTVHVTCDTTHHS